MCHRMRIIISCVAWMKQRTFCQSENWHLRWLFCSSHLELFRKVSCEARTAPLLGITCYDELFQCGVEIAVNQFFNVQYGFQLRSLRKVLYTSAHRTSSHRKQPWKLSSRIRSWRHLSNSTFQILSRKTGEPDSWDIGERSSRVSLIIWREWWQKLPSTPTKEICKVVLRERINSSDGIEWIICVSLLWTCKWKEKRKCGW